MASNTADRLDGWGSDQAIKAPCVAATTANITLSGTQTIDSVAVVAEDRVLVKNQTAAEEDGIYIAKASTWQRARDWNGNRDAVNGTIVIVKTGGTAYGNTLWRASATDDPYVIGTVEPTFVLAEFLIDISGRVSYAFDSSTTTSQDPGDGDFRLNHATIASATVLTLSDNSVDDGNPDISPWIITWDDSNQSSLRGTITISEVGKPNIFAIFSVSGAITDGTTYLDVPITYVTGSGSFTASTKYVFSFVRTGNTNTAGIQFDFDTSTSMANPGSGDIRFNNATVSSVTQIAISNTTSGSAFDASAFVTTWDDSSNIDIRSTLVIRNNTDLDEFAVFSITGAITDSTSWLQIPVTHVASSGTPASGDTVFLENSRTGDRPKTGIQMLFDTATTDSDQGVGKIWLNNGTVSSATVLYVDDVDNAAGTSINSQVDSWDDSTNVDLRGTINFVKSSDPAIFATFNVTGVVTSASTYSKIAVTHVTSAGTWADGDQVIMTFTRTGDIGAGSGVRMKFDTDTADSDQGAGTIWLNNGTISSATIVYLDDVEDAGGSSINSWVDSFDDSTHLSLRGTLKLTNRADPEVFAIFDVSGAVTSASTYSKVAVTYITGAGSFSGDDKVSVDFSRTGNDGTMTGLPMDWESTTTDTDQGAGKVWLNNATPSSANVLYMDDVERNSVSINSLVDSFDDSTTTALRGTLTVVEEVEPTNYLIFNVTGAVTSASTYSKIAVTHVLTSGSMTDGNSVRVNFVRTGNTGSGDMSDLTDDSSPQLGGDLDCNGSQIQWSKGADVASNSALPVLTDGNYFDVTGTTSVTSINTTGGAGTLIKLHFDGAVTLTHHSSNLIIAGAANFTTEAGDEVEFVEYDTGKYRMTGWSLAGTAPGGGGGGAFLGEGASGASVGDSGDIIRVNQQTLDTNQTMVATDNGSCTGPFAIASGVTLTLASGSTFKVL